MAVDLDEFDLHIVDVLLRDGRLPASQLADMVGLSRAAVTERVAKLERGGVIRGNTIVVDPAALGRTITAFVAARGPTLSPKAKKAFDALMKIDEVVEAHTVAGDDCFLIKVRTSSIASLNTLVSKLTAPPLSLSTRTTIVMKTHFEKIGGVTLGEDA
ncbi:MAG TPA: Lrp/AsnC family transcriptional regulator [Thermoanaerobaculia bacterium]|nr:Lrp/AsnC family transcriptional regulator [Thermoanaerobaculia bacterium]